MSITLTQEEVNGLLQHLSTGTFSFVQPIIAFLDKKLQENNGELKQVEDHTINS